MKSGIQGLRPKGSMSNKSAVNKLAQMKVGLAGNNSCCPPRMIMTCRLSWQGRQAQLQAAGVQFAKTAA